MQFEYEVHFCHLCFPCFEPAVSATDNPLVDASTSQVHHGGNFQALALTTAFEKNRLAIYLLGKLLFAQATELLNPAFNQGLPPSAAATDPSLNYHAKVRVMHLRIASIF